MAKKKSRIKHGVKSKKIHPLITMLMGFFAVVALGVVLTANAYKDVSPMQEVAGAESSVNGTPTPNLSLYPHPSITPTQSCLVMLSVRGIQSCGKDSYKSIVAICGDSTQTKIASDGQCRSLTAWFTKLAQACSNHSSCKSPTPTPKITGTNTHSFHSSGEPHLSPLPSQRQTLRSSSTENH